MKTNVESRVFSITTLSATLPGAEGEKRRKPVFILTQLRASSTLTSRPGRYWSSAVAHEHAHLRRSWWWAILCKSTRLCRCRSGRRWGHRSGLLALRPEHLQWCHSTAAADRHTDRFISKLQRDEQTWDCGTGALSDSPACSLCLYTFQGYCRSAQRSLVLHELLYTAKQEGWDGGSACIAVTKQDINETPVQLGIHSQLGSRSRRRKKA